MIKIDKYSWLYSANCVAAAVMALAIGDYFNIERPYWAMMTIYITSQPTAGALRSKAIYRACGTVLGAMFAVLSMPLLVNTPLVFSLVLSGWVGLCLFVSLLDRTPRAYVVMLAGYTAALIAFPTVGNPGQIFDIAVARTEEILLGIGCATFTHSIFFPRPVGPALEARLRAWLADGNAWALDLLRGQDPMRLMQDRRHLAAAASEIHLMAVLLPFDTSALRDARPVIGALHQRMTLLISLLSGIGDRLAALGCDIAPVRPVLESLADWIARGCQAQTMPALADDLAAARTASIGRDWTSLLRESLLSRLGDLLVLLGECQALLDHLRHPDAPLPDTLVAALAGQGRTKMHRDIGLALNSAFAATLSVMLVCLVWIFTGWPEGAAAAAFAGIFCAVFAAMDDPAPLIGLYGVGTLISLPLAALYQFAVLPAIDGFAMLAVVLAPPLLALGLVQADRRRAVLGFSLLAPFVSGLALQERYSAEFASFINVNTSIYVGLFIALFVTRAMRSMSVAMAAARLQTQIWRRLASLARRERPMDLAELATRQVDALGLVLPRLAAAGDEGDRQTTGAVTDLRIAMNIAVLQHNRLRLPAPQAQMLTRLLQAISTYYDSRVSGSIEAPDAALLCALDANLAQIAATTTTADRKGVTALVGLRRSLFPSAAPFQTPIHAELA